MLKDYSFPVDEQALAQLVHNAGWTEAYDLLATPLHEWLYGEQDFDALHSRSTLEQLILSFDYVQTQVGQGGLIQLIQNGYARLLVIVIESLQALNLAPQMIPVLDDVLKVLVLNKDVLGRETSVEEFGRLYHEFKEFEVLEERFGSLQPSVITEVVVYAVR